MFKLPDGRLFAITGTGLVLINLAVLFFCVSAESVSADPEATPSKTADTNSSKTSETLPGAEQTEIGLVEVAQEKLKTLEALKKAGKNKESLPVAKSTLAAIDKYLIATFIQTKFVKGLPPNVVSSARRHDADALCAFLDKELARRKGWRTSRIFCKSGVT